eukprot:CAMPEP_0116005336 /NCGR_PEP_ID=MMETSP0321-20121206/1111_1 /TAXON_ID=163516 /ORGANISM="Leptocylindrus danicus var. danicus, Strain B650" /LENGTH=217 /DNA_ID=CAMNT_0003473757 /DNA_START=41 /DNA_END=694 /DNA_ORIENTATION=+
MKVFKNAAVLLLASMLSVSAFSPSRTAAPTVSKGRAAFINEPSLKTPSTTVLNMGMFDRNDEEVFGQEKIISCLPYILPLMDGDKFGRYIYMRFPPLHVLEQIFLGPLVRIDQAVPFFGFGLFLVLALGGRNPELSRSIRFNVQQAILIDIALIFPELIGSAMSKSTPMYLVEPCTNFVFYAYAAACGYSIFSNLTGKTPKGIPIISEAAERAVGPF